MAINKIMKSSKTPKIYGLYDPRHPDDIKYVGVTVQNLNDRLSNHRRNIWETRNPTNKEKWIDRLKREGVQPEIKLLEECETVELMYEQEIVWIKQLRTQGHKLANTSKGGRGGWSYPKSDEWKQFMKEDNARRKLDPEYYEKLSTAQKLSYATNPERAKKIGAAHRLKAQDPVYREKLSQAAKLRWQDPEYRAKNIKALREAANKTKENKLNNLYGNA